MNIYNKTVSCFVILHNCAHSIYKISTKVDLRIPIQYAYLHIKLYLKDFENEIVDTVTQLGPTYVVSNLVHVWSHLITIEFNFNQIEIRVCFIKLECSHELFKLSKQGSAIFFKIYKRFCKITIIGCLGPCGRTLKLSHGRPLEQPP